MARPLELNDLIEHFMLRAGELELLRNKPARPGSVRLVNTFLGWKGRFPRSRSDLPDNTIEFVAKQVGVAAGELGFYDWDGRQIKRHRTETAGSPDYVSAACLMPTSSPAGWPRDFVGPNGARSGCESICLRRCPEEKIEPPTADRIGRIVGSALHQAEQALHRQRSPRRSTPI